MPLPAGVLPAAAATAPAGCVLPWQVTRGKVIQVGRWGLLSIWHCALAPLLLLGPLRCLLFLLLLLRWWWAHGTRPALLLLLLPQTRASPSPAAASAASCWSI